MNKLVMMMTIMAVFVFGSRLSWAEEKINTCCSYNCCDCSCISNKLKVLSVRPDTL